MRSCSQPVWASIRPGSAPTSARQLAFLGVALDADANAAAASREDVMIARGIRHAENPQPVPGAR
jgi:hypothetical protein